MKVRANLLRMKFVLCRLLARFQGDANRNQILAVPFSVRSMRAVSSKATISGVRVRDPLPQDGMPLGDAARPDDTDRGSSERGGVVRVNGIHRRDPGLDDV